MVECAGFEIRFSACTNGGSNPPLSARYPVFTGLRGAINFLPATLPAIRNRCPRAPASFFRLWWTPESRQ